MKIMNNYVISYMVCNYPKKWDYTPFVECQNLYVRFHKYRFWAKNIAYKNFGRICQNGKKIVQKSIGVWFDHSKIKFF